ncbi:hypothetical protein VOLCADRAFT_105729 [Volvox carteri f. nagariensis]|uniref:Phosphoribulokinase/uridine kinase domain-containing protein n=1 Tax=Volvox carteri f. nagariensis TaxID=3068 RepID=D8U2N3_VOLCA|nr:uncharacterized protein VOLCADRAFT_105729 [Volvox carteri f. nagariensis]EFJ45838.1 hypothetical protein VOLCADRAFT_105729 [Volvox carteri f. nagariensis]|eukprot:XP_002952916.1 hypothetical protein VOLCADRAFT_105729 [Volvox carteri f. nagariensis]
MLLTPHQQIKWPIITNRQLFRLNARAVGTSSRSNVCRAVELTGEAYEDIVDQLARRVLSRHSENWNSDFNSNSSSNSNLSSGRVVVGIAGAPGSGKTTLAAAVANRINRLRRGQPAGWGEEKPGAVAGGSSGSSSHAAPFAVVMPMDGFHFYRWELDAMPDPVEAHARRGAPWTFDAAKFVDAVRRVRLAAGCTTSSSTGSLGSDSEGMMKVSVRLPSFDHGVGDPREGDIVVEADTAVVLVEGRRGPAGVGRAGNYLLLDQEPWRQLRELFDETWFVSCPLDLVRQRLYDRQTGIGLAPEVSLERIRTNDLPNAELVVKLVFQGHHGLAPVDASPTSIYDMKFTDGNGKVTVLGHLLGLTKKTDREKFNRLLHDGGRL